MKYIISYIVLLFSCDAFAQNHVDVFTSTNAEINSKADTISSLKKQHDNGIRSIIVPMTIKIKRPTKLSINVKLIDYDHIASKPTLIDSGITISKSSFHNPSADSTKWQTYAICNIKLNDSSNRDEKFYIVKSDNDNNVVTVLIQKEVNSAPPSPARIAVSNMANKSHVHLDNSTSFIDPIYKKDSIRNETIIIKLTRDTIPLDKDTDNIVYSIDRYNFPFTLKLISRSNFNINGIQWNKTYDSGTKKTSIYYVDTLTIQNQYIKDTLTRNLTAIIRVNEDKSYHEINLNEKGLNERARVRGKLMYLNAYNFDFNSSLKSNYLGHFNVLLPPKKKNSWGVNLGVMKINYNNNFNDDSIFAIQNVLINPLDSIRPGTKYIKEFNKYKSTYQNTGWSIYIQPMFQINSDINSKIYLHGHIELFINNWSVTTTVTNIQKDTVKLDANNTRGGYFYAPSNFISNKTLYNGYFGGGLTFDLCPWETSSLFIQGSIGWTTNFPQADPVDDLVKKTSAAMNGPIIISTRGGTTYSQINSSKKGSIFYLSRVYLKQDISSSSTVIIGADIRGIFPEYNPLYAVYVGLNLDLTVLAKLL
jgi:hypothetical protein